MNDQDRYRLMAQGITAFEECLKKRELKRSKYDKTNKIPFIRKSRRKRLGLS